MSDSAIDKVEFKYSRGTSRVL